MKGIILAGGSGTRLYPLTQAVSKQLQPVYDKPMIYYPLSTLMLAGINEILIITTPHDQKAFQDLLGNGHHMGVELSYAAQPEPGGLAQAFLIGRDFVQGEASCLILGDNIFYGHDFVHLLQKGRRQVEEEGGAAVYGYWVNDPERYGVVDFDDSGKALSIEEKPREPKSNYAVVGLYFYDETVVEVTTRQKPSPRGELEITSVNQDYLNQGKLHVNLMGRGFAWLDAGTHESLLDAGNFVKTIEDRQGLKVSCPEEIAYKQGWINETQMRETILRYKKNQYGSYLESVLKHKNRP